MYDISRVWISGRVLAQQAQGPGLNPQHYKINK
jgi:hypothetical protein